MTLLTTPILASPPQVTLLELFSYRLGWAVCRQSARLNELSQCVASLPLPHRTHTG